MKKLLPAIDIVTYVVVIGWFVQKYFKNGFKDLTDFIIPWQLVYFLFMTYIHLERKNLKNLKKLN